MLKPQHNSFREIVSLDGFWQFRRDPEKTGEREGWSSGFRAECELAVPGSWNEQRSDLTHYFGCGWYQRPFAAGPGWLERGVVLHAGAAQRRARVWLNGKFAGEHRGGCLPFECDLGPLLRSGKNLLVIEVDGSLDPWDLPPARLKEGEERAGFHNSNPAVTYDFFPFAGLHRSVCLQLTPTPARLETVRITTTVSKDRREAIVETTLTCSGTSQDRVTSVSVTIDQISREVILDQSGRAILKHVLVQPRLWDVGQPELYAAVIGLHQNEHELDRYEQSFGIRTIEVRGDEFLLNGRPVFLSGFGKHEDFAIAGRGFVAPVVVRDFDLMQWIGANSFRTSHYPYAEEWYEYADRHGVLVVAETPFVGLNARMYCPDVMDRASGLLREMIQRDQHHPSVVMWSLANEPDIETAEGDAFFRRLAAEARALDPSRPITYVAHREPGDNQPLDCYDVVCLNKYYGWYENPGDIEGSLADFGACLDRFRQAFKKPVLLAEFGADAVAGMHLQPAEMFSEEFQADIIAAQYHEARRRPWVIGTHVWTFADFKTAQSITRVTMNRKGIFTRDRQPKLAAHRLRALWQQKS